MTRQTMGRSYQTFPQHLGRYQQEQVLDPALQAFVDFIRVRMLNFAVAGLLSVAYLLYQYWGLLFASKQEELDGSTAPPPRSRSRSSVRERERDYKDKLSVRHTHRRHGHGRRNSDQDYDR